jgi:hypothetical protein
MGRAHFHQGRRQWARDRDEAELNVRFRDRSITDPATVLGRVLSRRGGGGPVAPEPKVHSGVAKGKFIGALHYS